MPAGVAQPRHAQPLTDGEAFDTPPSGNHGADDLMAGYQGQPGLGKFAVQYVQVGAAYAAGADLEQHLVGATFWPWQFGQSQRRTG